MPFSFSRFVRSQWGNGPHSKLLQQWRMGKKLEILKGNDKYNIIGNNSNTDLLYLTLTGGLFRQ